MQHFENKYNVLGPSPQQAHTQRPAQQKGMSHHATSSQQQQQQQHQQLMQYRQQQMNERSRQQQHGQQRLEDQQQMLLQQQNSTSYYGNINQQDLMLISQESQTSPTAFQWPPNTSQQQGQRGIVGDGSSQLTFSSGVFYDTSQTDAEIDAILSNYQPKLYANMQSFGSSMMSDQMNNAISSQADPSHQRSIQTLGTSTASTDASQQHAAIAQNRDQMDQAAAAVAAYGHLNYGNHASTSNSNIANNNYPSDQVDLNQWNPTFASNAVGLGNGAGLDFQRGYSTGGGCGSSNGNSISEGNGAQGVAYDADASNTSSTQTPGGVSSGDDSTGGKRRRMTGGGTTEAKNQQDRFEAGLSTGGFDGKGASAAQSMTGGTRPLMQHHGTSTIDSRSLEKMAQESLQRAGEDNARGMNKSIHTPHTTPNRPVYRHRRSNSGSHIHGASSASTSTLQNVIDSTPKFAHMHKKNSLSTSYSIRPSHSYPHQAAAMSGLGGGFAASHPPGLGSHVLRSAPDAGASGTNAITDFTKRKGWPTRIVEELLDFVHVLDRQGRVLFASPSVLTLTGWRADELKGQELTDFVHPDDRESVRLEFQRSLMERTEMTMYYRFQRKPQTAADKQRVHDQREAQHVSRSRSGSTSGGDSSSAPDNNAATSTKQSTFANGAIDNHLVGGGLGTLEEEGEFQNDQREKYVIFEATGHPYYSPQGSFPESELNQEMVEESLPKAIANSRSQVSKSSANKNLSPSSISIKMESPTRPTDAKESRGALDGKTNADIQCFFCSCRIYPTRNVGMLDSFLELKLENERLRTLLSELSVSEGSPNGITGLDAGSDGRKSLDEGQAGYHLDYLHDIPEQQQMQPHHNMVGGSIPPSHANRGSLGSSTNIDGNQQVAQRTLDRRDSSRSASGGQISLPTSPTLGQALERTMTGATGVGEDSDDQGSPNTLTAEERRKKKKTKSEEGDYVCTDCGRVDSPEWRKGPLGPKTLCNACGLRWAKKVKRNGGDPNAIAMAAKPVKGQIKAEAAAARAQKQNYQYQHDSNSDSYQSAPPSASLPSSLSQQPNTPLKMMQQSTTTTNPGYPNRSPPNSYEVNTYGSIYSDPSSMAHQQQHHQMSNQIPSIHWNVI